MPTFYCATARFIWATVSQPRSVTLPFRVSVLSPLALLTLGQFGKKLIAAGRERIEAYALLSVLVKLDRDQARAYLESKGIPEDARDGILAASHCDAPDNYLIVNSELVTLTRGWVRLGLWDDPRRVFL